MPLNPDEVLIWRARLDGPADNFLPALLPEQEERAARFSSEDARRRYTRSHRIVRAILGSLELPDRLSNDPHGRPYLPGFPDVRLSLSRSRGMALFAVADGVDVGVDIECIRPLPECEEIAERFLPPSAYRTLLETPVETREREFFRIWTRLESRLKAMGVGLYGAGQEVAGEWTIEDVDAGGGFAAAVAARAARCRIRVRDF